MSTKINFGAFHPVEEHLLFFQEHSLAITQWAMLEQTLGRLVAAGFPDKETSQAIFNAFFGIESFRSKLEFADRYLQRRLVGDDQLLSYWASIRVRLEGSAKTRNNLVHWSAIGYFEGPPGRRYVLQPPALKASDKRLKTEQQPGQPPSHALCTLEIAKIRFSFFDTMVALDNLHSRAAGKGESLLHSERSSIGPTMEALRSSLRSMSASLR